MPKEFPRKGAWCLVAPDDSVGIIFEKPSIETTFEDRPHPEDPSKMVRTRVDIVHEDQADVHLVDENTGETTETLRGVELSRLSQAQLEHIPATRRPDLDIAVSFGYAEESEESKRIAAARSEHANGGDERTWDEVKKELGIGGVGAT